MPIISKKQEIELSFTNIIIDGDNEIEIDFDLYNDVNNKLRLKASKNRKIIFDWPLESIREINEFISSKLKFDVSSKEKVIGSISNSSVKAENYLTNAATILGGAAATTLGGAAATTLGGSQLGGAQEFESFIQNKNQGAYSNSSSLVSSQAFMSALTPDATLITKVENERINSIIKGFDSVEIDLEVDIDNNEDISSGKEDEDGI